MGGGSRTGGASGTGGGVVGWEGGWWDGRG